MKTSITVSLAMCLAAATPAASAVTLNFDFGDISQTTPGNYNNVTYLQAPILNAIDSAGANTGIGLNASGFNEIGANLNGTTTRGAPANVFDSQATRDNLFGHTSDFNAGSPRPTATLAFTGLDGSGSTLYAFTFFASRTGVTDNRETKYAVTGANAGEALLNVANNSSDVAVVSGITPTAGGAVTITLTKGPSNSNGDGFFYLGALQVDSSRIPEPSSGTLLVGIGAGLSALRRRACG